MLFGIGMTLTEDEDKQLVDVVRPCYASLALANDYFSFDREWEEAQEPGAPKPVNAVWHYMRWQGVDVATAKRLVRDAANTYERMYLGLCDEFRKTHAPISEKLDRYLDALGYQISGNVVWSLNCPRYHPRFRYDPNAGLEDEIMATSRYPPKVEEDDLEDQINTSSGQSSETASMDGSTEKKSSPPLTPTSTVYSDDQRKASISLPTESLLGLEVGQMSRTTLLRATANFAQALASASRLRQLAAIQGCPRAADRCAESVGTITGALRFGGKRPG